MPAPGRSANSGWLQEGMIRGHMLGKTMLPSDEELGKKDDDHRYSPARRSGWSIWNHTFRWRRRRILLAVVALFLTYMVWNSLNGFDGQLGTPHHPPLYNPSQVYDEPIEPTGPPPGIRPSRGAPLRIFDGQVRFYRLAHTLRKSAGPTDGYARTNRNVLFAMASLKSASTLLPMICEMSKWSRNHVHAAFMGMDDISLEDLLEINGIDKVKCPAIWHDARSDYMVYSIDDRAERSVVGALSHIYSFLHPQVAIMDDALSEDAFFVRGFRNKTKELDLPLIEVPKGRVDSFMWFTRLDAGSLHSWHMPTIDVVIQVPPASSNVLRLLKSIKDADYSGLKPPRITLELPAELDESVKKYVQDFKWPPHIATHMTGSGLTIHRRIANPRATQEDVAIRFLELFYPTSTDRSHVLLLSPHAQVSPLFFHYIKYAVLEYKHSTFGVEDNINLMGVSLELPSLLPDGETKLTPPSIRDMYTDRYKKLYPETSSAPFLWQAPNSHATLFFGNKWAELHSFLSSRVVKHQQAPKPAPRAKLVSETLPAWTEYVLEFMRARGYSLLYPATSTEAFVTVHNDLYRAPEEFSTPHKSTAKPNAPTDTNDEPFLRGDVPARPPTTPETPVIPISKPLHLALPFDGDLPELPHLPQMLYDGRLVNIANVSIVADTYANQFREEVGGCQTPMGKHRKVFPGEAKDLFCFGDEDENDWEDDVEEGLFKVEVVDEDGWEVPMTADPVVPTVMASRVGKFTRETGVASER